MELEDRRLQQDFQNFNISHMGLEVRKFQRSLCPSHKSERENISSETNHETHRRHVVLGRYNNTLRLANQSVV